ncbi:MAG TPA: PTS fructose transporter subunit IIC [Candidatus Angelobacter sp.]|jgi:fructose-specific phosphotransferase system IIC component|nr:PTS fructose transporter subunit IIC [Candidatus Angelobacter sp.]
MIEQLRKLRQHLLTGVSYVIPFIACGGILIAFSITFAPMSPNGPDFSHLPTLKLINDIGSASFFLMLSVLAGYIAYSIAGRPGLVPGFIGGYLSGQIKAGFLGAILIGLLAGYIVELIKKIPVSKYLRPIMPILIIPIVASSVIGIVMLKVLGVPIAHLMTSATEMLKTMSTGSSIWLAMVLGAMIAFDMGGPINKTAFTFGMAMLSEGDPRIMGACAAAICTPPLGLGLATFLRKKLWNEEEREAGIAGLAMGMIGITEGAIPFAAADPVRVIPCIVVGSMVASVIAMLGGVGDHASHGGPIVLPVVDHKLAYVVAILSGTMVTALCVIVVKSISRHKAPESKP